MQKQLKCKNLCFKVTYIYRDYLTDKFILEKRSVNFSIQTDTKIFGY